MINQRSSITLCLLVLLAGWGNNAKAQFGYGYYPAGYGGYGWGGWGGTYTGDVARGLGYYAAGVGEYNVDTAVADSINGRTLGAWNPYMFLSPMGTNRREQIRLDNRLKRGSQTSALAHPRLTR